MKELKREPLAAKQVIRGSLVALTVTETQETVADKVRGNKFFSNVLVAEAVLCWFLRWMNFLRSPLEFE